MRADAGMRMGTGHVMRCIALGQAWKDAGGDVVFVTCCDSDAIRQRLFEEGFVVVELSAAHSESKNDLTITLETAKKMGANWIVTDGYHFDLAYQQGIRRAGFKLLCVDDYNHLPKYEADVLLNQNIGAEELSYHCNPKCRKLLGTKYVMLRREFRLAKPRPRSGSVRTILVTMGGSDPDNATLKVIEAFSQLEVLDVEVKVVVGAANPHLKTLQHAVDLSPFDLRLLTEVKDMPSLICWADFAITAAGSTCWELASMKVPFATVILAENQERIAQWLERQAGVPMLGWVDSSFRTRCAAILSACFPKDKVDQSCQEAISVVDCFGTDRILKQVTKDYSLDILKNRLALRAVTEDDASLLLAWANDSATRSNSFNSGPISLESHLAWFDKRLNNDRVQMFMLEIDGMPCGHIRYELDEKGDAVLSFVVSPAFRGMGIGQKLVELSRPQIAVTWVGCRIKALTLSENKASSIIFVKTGFVPQKTGQIHGKECNIYCWSNFNDEG